jgi:hypothetical protein
MALLDRLVLKVLLAPQGRPDPPDLRGQLVQPDPRVLTAQSPVLQDLQGQQDPLERQVLMAPLALLARPELPVPMDRQVPRGLRVQLVLTQLFRVRLVQLAPQARLAHLALTAPPVPRVLPGRLVLMVQQVLLGLPELRVLTVLRDPQAQPEPLVQAALQARLVRQELPERLAQLVQLDQQERLVALALQVPPARLVLHLLWQDLLVQQGRPALQVRQAQSTPQVDRLTASSMRIRQRSLPTTRSQPAIMPVRLGLFPSIQA